jgi:hypothetical protein
VPATVAPSGRHPFHHSTGADLALNMYRGWLLVQLTLLGAVGVEGLHRPAAALSPPPAGFTLLPRAVATIYQGGVPHTDRNGNRLMQFDATKSFLPLVLYDAQLPCNGTTSELKGQTCLPKGHNATVYTSANFTGVLPYQASAMSEYMQDHPAGFGGTTLQVIREAPSLIQTPPGPMKCPPTCDGRQENEPKVYKYDVHRHAMWSTQPCSCFTFKLSHPMPLCCDGRDHPNMLGWFLREEPTGEFWAKNMSGEFSDYKAEYAKVKAEDPKHPIFILDCPWITEPATPWWIKWNTYGDVSSHDNYPFDFHSTSLAHINGNGGGIPQTVGLAVSRSVHLE